MHTILNRFAELDRDCTGELDMGDVLAVLRNKQRSQLGMGSDSSPELSRAGRGVATPGGNARVTLRSSSSNGARGAPGATPVAAPPATLLRIPTLLRPMLQQSKGIEESGTSLVPTRQKTAPPGAVSSPAGERDSRV